MGKKLTDENRLSIKCPELSEEWDYSKNYPLTPQDVTYGSHRKRWWLCRTCNHSWEAIVNNRGSHGHGCPACTNQVVTDKNRLSLLYPELCKEWDYANNALLPDSFSFGSRKSVWWKCTSCEHRWKSIIYNRTTHGQGCPACSGNIVTIQNSLSSLFPQLLQSWDYSKNKFSPEHISCGSDKKVWWKCNVCGHSYYVTIYKRLRGDGCQACSRRLLTDINRLSTQRPDLLLEWDYEKNAGVSPDGVSVGLGIKVWWKCQECKHSWLTGIRHRAVERTGCPICVLKRSFSGIEQEWLNSVEENNGVKLERQKVIYLGGAKPARVDGFDPDTNTVYEFLGDFWHGNPDVFEASCINTVNGKTFHELYESTKNRIQKLESCGYKVVYVWEKDFRETLKTNAV